MKALIFITLFAFSAITFAIYYESSIDPYQEGTHLDYYIQCENGFVYKIQGSTISKHSIQVLNSDGTPLKCGEKIY